MLEIRGEEKRGKEKKEKKEWKIKGKKLGKNKK
jgi:hypothetical protein